MQLIRLYSLLLLSLMLPGCEIAEGIFKVGFWAGILVVALVIGLVIWIIRKLK